MKPRILQKVLYDCLDCDHSVKRGGTVFVGGEWFCALRASSDPLIETPDEIYTSGSPCIPIPDDCPLPVAQIEKGNHA